MSGSTEPRAALVSIEDQGTMMALIDLNKNNIGTEQLPEASTQTQEVLMRVAQSSQPIREVQRVCDHLAQIIRLQRQITDLQTRHLVPAECDHSTFEQQLRTLREELEEARRIPRTPRTDEDLRQELDDMTWDTRQSGEKVRALRTQLEIALSSAAWVAPTPPQQFAD